MAEELSAVSVPSVSLFHGIRARTPPAELHVLNQAGHDSFREHPHEFNRLRCRFHLG